MKRGRPVSWWAMPEPRRYDHPSTRMSVPILGSALEALRVDLVPADPQPSWTRWILASAVALVGSLVADGLLVAIGKRVFPTTAHFAHFQFADYAKLTIIGVVVACMGWPVITRISSRPRWLFLRLAVAVTIVLLLPDVYILVQGEPAQAVLVLVLMHLAIAAVTYNSLVRIAPAGEFRRRDVRTVVDA